MATDGRTSSPPAHGLRREWGSCRVPGSLAGVTCGVREQWPRRRGGLESLPFPESRREAGCQAGWGALPVPAERPPRGPMTQRVLAGLQDSAASKGRQEGL